MLLSSAAGLTLACSLGLSPTPIPTIAQEEREYVSPEEAAGAAIEAIRSGDFERARAILGAEIVLAKLDEATRLLDAGQPATALPRIDAALDVAPRDGAALLLRAEGLLALGEQRMDQGGGFVPQMFTDAEDAFERGGRSPHAFFGRARCAYLMNRADDARELALEGARRLRQAKAVEASSPADPEAAAEGRDPADPPVPLDETYRFGSAQRIVADSCYLAYAEAAQALFDQTPEASATREADLFAEALGELDALVAVAPEDPATWLLLSNLHLYRSQASGNVQDTERALDAVHLGLDRLPEDNGLLDRLVTTARNLGGSDRAIAELERRAEASSTSHAIFSRLGAQGFEAGLDRVPSDLGDTAGFEAANLQFESALASFEQARGALAEGDERLRDLAGWSAISTTASGWMSYWSGDLARARELFLESESFLPGGAQWSYGDRMRSAVRGLQGLVGKHNERGELLLARTVQDDLVQLLPEDSTMWNDAGFFRRDVATALEFQARELCRAAAGEESDPERLVALREVAEVAPELYDTEAEKRMFRERSEVLLAEASAEMERSAEAYERALELAPDDVLVLNDSALLYVYYLHRDLDVAETRFLRAIELGAEQLAGDLDDQTRALISVPYGDAHENLGVLYFEHRGQPERARTFFEQAVEFGPAPRPVVTDYYLPRCDGEDPSGFARDVLGWGGPCD